MQTNHRVRTSLIAVLAMSIPVAHADDAEEAHAIIDRAIEAMGGAKVLAKYKAFSAKIKGNLHTDAGEISFTGEIATQGADQEMFRLDMNIDGQLFSLTHVLNQNRGWVKVGEDLVEMDKEQVAEALEQAHVGWVASLIPLRDKAFTLSTVGEVDIDEKPALGVRVSHAGRRDVNLFFSKSTQLLVKTEARVKDDESGREVTEETFFSAYDNKDLKTALKLTVKRDGKLYLVAELSDVRLEEKLDDAVFAMP
jgi:hypothetical protein